ncbi:hypothetical protein [Candidatus Marithrix sp. Canyon 246]|uniref:hypothetical protein n=1 Tax=Candidatus Marithrix sp. Canyon 246 TaxID=1827136 RepID=UPI001495F584|nr:hypothetical protein [Candidatus Marithrix sp. Canyon 246]
MLLSVAVMYVTLFVVSSSSPLVDLIMSCDLCELFEKRDRQTPDLIGRVNPPE